MHPSSARPSACKRLAAALAASTLAHMLLTSAVKPGSARGDIAGLSSTPVMQKITTRLVPVEPDPPTRPESAEREPSAPDAPVQTPVKRSQAASAAQTSVPKAASAGPAEMPDPTYYAARQLDVYPALLTALDPRDGSAATASVNGHVLLLVLIDGNGVVENVRIVEAEPAGHFDDHARRAFENARFSPAIRNGRAVKSRVLIELDFGRAETASR